MKKNISLIAVALLIAAASLFTVSCKDEFQVEESQLYGKWYFPLDLAPDTVTGFNWAGDSITFKAPDTMWVQDYPGMKFNWTLRDNNVTATCKPRANVDESYVVAFTVYEASTNALKITGKFRYIYNGENTPRGDISCTLSKTNPNPAGK